MCNFNSTGKLTLGSQFAIYFNIWWLQGRSMMIFLMKKEQTDRFSDTSHG
jgi:hypothetical protein